MDDVLYIDAVWWLVDTVIDEDRGSQELPGSPGEQDAHRRRCDFNALRATAKAIASAPLLLQHLTNDLLTAVLDGGAAQRYIALELASLAHTAIEPLQALAQAGGEADRERVRSTSRCCVAKLLGCFGN